MARKFIYVRSRNQITLPADVVSHLNVGENDYLQVEVSPGGKVQLAPARLATLGTPEADEQNRRADEDIKAGRFRIFKDAESFSRSLKEQQPDAPPVRPVEEIERELIAAVLLDTDWNKKRAAERLGWAPSRLSVKMKKLKLTPEAVK